MQGLEMGLSCLWLDSFCLLVQSLFLASIFVFSEPWFAGKELNECEHHWKGDKARFKPTQTEPLGEVGLFTCTVSRQTACLFK